MDDVTVSQEEINGLFKVSSKEEIRDEVKQILRILNDAIENLSSVLSKLIGKNISLTNPRGQIADINSLNKVFEKTMVICDFAFTSPKNFNSMIILGKEEGSFLADLLTNPATERPSEDFSDLKINALSEVCTNIISSFSNAFNAHLKKNFTYTRPKIDLNTVGSRLTNSSVYLKFSDFVLINYDLDIGDIVQGKLYYLLPLNIVKEILNMGTSEEDIDLLTSSLTGESVSEIGIEEPKESPQEPSFQPIETEKKTTSETKSDIDFLMDVPLKITVELGRSEMQIRDVLQLGPGSVVELDRLAGEAVNMLVNGKLIAKGEVVVIDENFGIRITEIITPAERLSKLK